MSEEWVVHWTPRSERFVRKLGKGSVTDRIRQEVESLTTRPKRGKYFPKHDIYSLRIGTPGGEYRAIYQLIPEDHAILSVLRAGGIKELIDKWESTAAKRGSRALILRLMLIFAVALLSSMLVHLLRG